MTNTIGATHWLTWPTSSTYACGADAVGRRSLPRDTDKTNTTCSRCLDVQHSLEEDVART